MKMRRGAGAAKAHAKEKKNRHNSSWNVTRVAYKCVAVSVWMLTLTLASHIGLTRIHTYMIRCALLSYFTTPIFAPFSASFSSFRTINRNKSCGYSENFWCVEKLAAALQCFKLYVMCLRERKVRRWDVSKYMCVEVQRQQQWQPTNFVRSCIFRFHFNCSHSTQTGE